MKAEKYYVKCENPTCNKEVPEDDIIRFCIDGEHHARKICRHCYLTGEWVNGVE